MAKYQFTNEHADEILRQYLRRHYGPLAADVRAWNIDRAPDRSITLTLTLWTHEDFMETDADYSESVLETKSSNSE